MNLKQLELFVAVAETGGFTAAADREGTAQPFVSATIRRLEDELGGRLLNRGARPLTLTPAGEALLRHAASALASIKAAGEDVRSLNAGTAGTVVMGAPPMVSGHLLAEPLTRFVRDHPGVRLKLVQMGAERIREAVVRGEIDAGIIAGWREAAGVRTTLLRREPIVAWTAAGSALAEQGALSWETLLGQPLVAFPDGYYQRTRLEQEAERLGVRMTIALEAESVALIGRFVQAGAGVATTLASVPPPPGVTAVALPENAWTPIALCERGNAGGPAAARLLTRHLIAGIARDHGAAGPS
jgi:DNA-binding transcriptional LysR family regulator